MSIDVEWSSDATDDLLRIPSLELAETVARAVRRYAEEGVGFVLHVPVPIADGPDEYRLLIPRARTYVRIHRSATVLYVERVIFRP